MTNAEEAIRFFERHLKEDVLKYGEQPAIHMAIAALRGQPNVVETDHVDRWISCADRLPKGHNPVLVCRVGVRGRVFVEVGYYAGDGRWRIQSTLAQNVPYWMPMPEAPAQLFPGREPREPGASGGGTD